MEPDIRPNLSSCLSRLNSSLSLLERAEDACAVRQEAIHLYRRAYEINPTRYQLDFAKILFSLGGELRSLGKVEEACLASQECVTVLHELCESEPLRFQHDLIQVLRILRVDLVSMGRSEEASAVDQERVTVLRLNHATDPDVHLPILIHALQDVADDFRSLGVASKASPHSGEHSIEVAKQLVAVSRQLYDLRQEVHHGTFADALYDLVSELEINGRPNEALAARQEHTAISTKPWPLSLEARCNGIRKVSSALEELRSNLLSQNDATSASRELVNLRRKCFELEPQRHEAPFVRALEQLRDALSGSGCKDESVLISHELIALLRERHALRVTKDYTALSYALGHLCGDLHALGRPEQAFLASEERAALHRQLRQASSVGTFEYYVLEKDLLNVLQVLKDDFFAHRNRETNVMTVMEHLKALLRTECMSVYPTPCTALLLPYSSALLMLYDDLRLVKRDKDSLLVSGERETLLAEPCRCGSVRRDHPWIHTNPVDDEHLHPSSSTRGATAQITGGAPNHIDASAPNNGLDVLPLVSSAPTESHLSRTSKGDGDNAMDLPHNIVSVTVLL